MTNETLYEVLGDINEDHIQAARAATAKRKKPAWVKWGAVAACICLVAVGGAVLKNWLFPQSFHDMMHSRLTISEALAYVMNIDIGDRAAAYEKISIKSERLKKYVGQLYAQTDEFAWYYVRDLEDLKYLIRKDADGTLTLWEFTQFVVEEGETYTYGDVMSIIYGVESAEDIDSITAKPSVANNTDEGKKAQEEVGTHTYSDREDIAAFYNIVTEVVCFGGAQESVADENRFTYSFSTDAEDKLTSLESTYGTRSLTVTLKSGTTIDSWQYSALSGSFFEYGGLFTQPLSDENVSTLNEMFGIK